MFFDFFRRRRKQADSNPLAAFDGVIEELERQGAALRRSAATLLAAKGELTRAQARYEAQVKALREREGEATGKGEGKVAGVLTQDVAGVERRLSVTREALARAEADGAVLLEAAEEVARDLASLREERVSVAARLTVDTAVARALEQRRARIERVLAVEAARDEVERAHALADIYREEHRAAQERVRG